MTTHSSLALDSLFTVTEETRERFRRDGFIKIKNVLTAEEIARVEPVITALVVDLQKTYPALEKDGFYHKQFVQVGRAWWMSETVREFTFSKRFAKMAADLMGVQGVRLYHDQALYKLPGGSHTLHHQDLSYWPLDTEKACALWIPFQPVPLEMGPLAFYRGSHQFPYRSVDVITPEGEAKMMEKLKSFGCEAVHEAFDLGEVSFHSGWTCHTAKPNQTDKVRKVHTINYFEDGTRLVNPTPNQVSDWKILCPDIKIGQVIDGPLTPVLWRY